MSNNTSQINSVDKCPATPGGTAQGSADRLPPPPNPSPKSNPSNIKK